MKKRVLAIAMSLAMTLSLLPVSALAAETGETPEEETSTVNSIQETNSSEKAENQDQELTADVKIDEDTQVTVGDSVENPVVTMDGKGYASLADAVAAVHELTGAARMQEHVIELQRNASGGGSGVGYANTQKNPDGTITTSGNNPVNITFDLNGFTYTVTNPTSGSSGTETNGFQLLQNSIVTFKDGTLFSELGNIVIQNYSDLTLDDVTIEARNAGYVVSNNCGNINFKGNTSITAGPGNVAFDVCSFANYPGVTVNVDTTGTITGKIEITRSDGNAGEGNLLIKNGTFKGTISKSDNCAQVEITGGTFDSDVSEYIPSGMKQEGGEVVIDNEKAVASVNGVGYDDLQKAINAAGNGDTVKLLNNVVAEKTIKIKTSQSVVLDLDIYKISDSESLTTATTLIENNGTLTITGEGTIDATGSGYLQHAIQNITGGNLTVESGTIIGRFEGIRSIGKTVAIKGGTVSAVAENAALNMAVHAYGGEVSVSGDAKITGVNTAITVAGSKLSILGNASLSGMFGVILLNKAENNSEGAQPASLTMTGGTIQANGGFALSGNNLKSAGCSAKITGGSLEQTTGETCIYWPMEGSLTVGGNAVVEGGSGIEAKMGTIAIQGSAEIRGTGAYLANEPIANGSQADGSAILVSTQMYGNNNGQYISSPDLTVTITGGTLQSTQGNAVTVYNTEDIEAQTAKVSITGGELNAADGKAAVQVTNADKDGKKTSTLTTENGKNAFKTAKSQTTVIVSASAALAAVDQTGGVAYYTDANDALESANNSANENVQPHVYVLDDGSVDSGKLSNKDVSLTTAQNVDLLVSSGVPGMIVQGTTNQDGSKTYKLVENTQDVELSAPTVTLSADRTYVYTGEKITLTASASHNDPSITFGYVWYKDEKVMSGASENTLTVTESGSYSVGVVAIKEGNDSNYSSEEGRSNVINCTVTARPSVDPDRPSGGGSSSSDSGDYLITVDRVSGGRVTVQPGRADRGDTVTITVYPNDGYELDELVVTDSRGNEIDLDARSATRFTFTMPSGKVTVEASFIREGGQSQTPQTTFMDVPASAWYYDAVEYVYENGLMSGVSGGRFAPNDTLTRAMLVQTLYAMEGRPAAASAGFADVASGDWYASAVNWAAANGVVSGVSETGFGPNNALTREQLALILYRFAQYKGYDVTGTSDLAAYADGSSVSGWAAEAMGWAVDAGLISGVGGNQIAPTGTASRAQVAQILMNFCENVAR